VIDENVKYEEVIEHTTEDVGHHILDQCFLNSTKKDEAERRCNQLRMGIFKRELQLYLY
jgi:hypothetical protein